MTSTKEKIEVMQAFLDGKPVEWNDGRDWRPMKTPNPTWSWLHYDYRIKSAKPDSIDWDHVSPTLKYMARDEDGKTYLYAQKPCHYKGMKQEWAHPGGRFVDAELFTSYKRGDVDWEDSLVIRPS